MIDIRGEELFFWFGLWEEEVDYFFIVNLGGCDRKIYVWKMVMCDNAADCVKKEALVVLDAYYAMSFPRIGVTISENELASVF